jgi:tRNA dimethylallyltransferase
MKRLICILGPTASGKSDYAFEYAGKYQGEIISADAMQVYRGMDIGTAKPSFEMQKKVKHHLINSLNPNENYDVARFVQEAKVVIADCFHRGVQPIICGGTNYYVTSLLDGIAPVPQANWELRDKWESLAVSKGGDYLWQELKKVDPISAERVHKNDTKRLVRAIEVYEISGQPLSSFRPEGGVRERYVIELLGIKHNKEILKERIAKRMEYMFEEGLLQEVKSLREIYSDLSHTAREAIGYKEVIAYLEHGDMEEDSLKRKIIQNTVKLVKKQMTWLNAQPDIHWMGESLKHSPPAT